MVSGGEILILQISRPLLEFLPLQRLPAPAACSRQKSNCNCPPISFSHLSLIPGGDDDMDFDIEKSTGSMVIARALDARKKSSYNLTVEVTDGSTTIKTQVMLFSLAEIPSRASIHRRESSDPTELWIRCQAQESPYCDLTLHSGPSLSEVPS